VPLRGSKGFFGPGANFFEGFCDRSSTCIGAGLHSLLGVFQTLSTFLADVPWVLVSSSSWAVCLWSKSAAAAGGDLRHCWSMCDQHARSLVNWPS